VVRERAMFRANVQGLEAPVIGNVNIAALRIEK
jgi:hypothetical protein